jgi:hypothetical protein
LCRTGTNLSAMLTGNPDSNLRIVFYEDLPQALAKAEHFLHVMSS